MIIMENNIENDTDIKKKKVLKYIRLPLSVLICVLIFIFCLNTYLSKYKTIDIDCAFSDDGKYKVIFQSVGSPDFPFGNTHARLILKENNKTIQKFDFDIANDGKNPDRENWYVIWYKNNVQTVIHGEEQQDIIYTLYFDGTASKKTTEEKEVTNDNKDNLQGNNIEYKKLDISILQQRQNELVFSFTVEDFINDYNALYCLTHEKCYILPLSFDNWNKQTLEMGIHSPYETVIYDYSADRSMWPLPTISVFVPSDGFCVQEISLNFDWHSYTEEVYTIYKEICYITLKILFPDCPDEQITKLYTEAIQSGYDNMFSSDEWYGKDSVPVDFYYKDTIGIYSHFAEGSRQRLCIIPVNDNTVEEFRRKGSAVHKIDSSYSITDTTGNISE